jgi:hypothetical protein
MVLIWQYVPATGSRRKMPAVELPRAAKAFADAGQAIGLVDGSGATLIDAESKQAQTLFEACGAAGVAHIKIGSFLSGTAFDDGIQEDSAHGWRGS